MHIDTIDKYKQLYKQSISEPDKFWAKIAERLSWYRKWDDTRKYDFINGGVDGQSSYGHMQSIKEWHSKYLKQH